MKKPEIAWGAKAIGDEINRSPSQTFYLLERGLIQAARKVGLHWVADKEGLRKQFSPGLDDTTA